MMKIKTILFLAALLFNAWAIASPCVPYKFNFNPSIMRPSAVPGVLTVSWSYQDKCNIGEAKIEDRQFLVTIATMFNDVLLSEEIKGNIFTFNTSKLPPDETNLIFEIKEASTGSSAQMLIKLSQDKNLQLSSRTDSLNFCLQRGYFFNAVTMLKNMKRYDLVDEVLIEYDKIFPRYYNEERGLFNFYYNEKSATLIKMPYVENLVSFIKYINKLSQTGAGTPEPFSVYARISIENQIVSYHVIPEKFKDVFDKASGQLKFINNNNFETEVFINIGSESEGKKYVVINDRALQNPTSPDYKNFASYGAIH